MVEYGLLVSATISEMFSNFIWQLESLWNSLDWRAILTICLGIFIFFYFLLRKR